MQRFKGHSMVILNCGIPTIMLELTLISFCNIVNQITLHLKESRTRDLQLIFYILNLYTMQQLAFSPGSRNEGMYVHVCVCYVCSRKSSSAFSPLRDNWKVPLPLNSPWSWLFLVFFSPLSQKASEYFYSFLPALSPLCKSSTPFCMELTF